MTSQTSQDSHNSQVSHTFTCGDCEHFAHPVLEQPWCTLDNYHHDPSEPICPYFETRDGARPRYCRLASSVDEMAATLVEFENKKEEDKVYPCCDRFKFNGKEYGSQHKAFQAAKAWLMEVE